MPPTALTRIHSILKHAVSMRESDIELVCNQAEAILSDETFSSAPQLAACMLPIQICARHSGPFAHHAIYNCTRGAR